MENQPNHMNEHFDQRPTQNSSSSGSDADHTHIYSSISSYTTANGGSGVQYTPYDYHQQGGRASATRAKRKRAAKAVLAVALSVVLCFSAGAVGAHVANRLLGAPVTPSTDPSDEPDYQKNPSSDGVHSTTYTGNRVVPDMDKSASLESLTYTGSAGDRAYSTLAEAYEKVADSVVEISTETTVSGGWLGNYVSSGAGSGVIISKEGYIVTNNHVISGADTITVTLRSGESYPAALVGRDETSDIAVLYIDPADRTLVPASLGCSADLIVGEDIFVIGNPLGSLGGTLTNGIISATARDIVINKVKMTLLQTNAAVNPGNSGGGMFNMAGQLVGVVNAKCSEDDVEGLGFAIPVDSAYEVICQLIRYGYVRGVVDTGLELYNISPSNIIWARHYFGSSQAGVYILSSAYSTELAYGDLLVKVGDVKVGNSGEAEAAFENYAVGDTVTLTIVRSGNTLTVDLTLKEYVPSGVGNVDFGE